jgi:ubiquinone/menaquinone biosynthesis C-methylase UbiE
MTDRDAAAVPAARLRELRAVAAEIAHPRPSILAAIDRLELQAGQRVLDAGCGPGAHLLLFAERVAPGGEVIGVDLDRERLAMAAAVCADLIAAGAVRLIQGDAATLPVASDACDVAWSAAVFHHLADQEAVLAELVRVTRPGGLVAILDADNSLSFPLLPWPPELEPRLRAAMQRGEAKHYGGKLSYVFDGYAGRKLPRLLREAGLVERRLFAFSDLDLAPLPPHREEEIRDWLLGSFLERLRDELTPVDIDRYRALFDPDVAGYLLRDPDFFLVRTWLLATGRKAD